MWSMSTWLAGGLLVSASACAQEQRWIDAGETGLATSGEVTSFEMPEPSMGPTTIALDPDGDVWFTLGSADAIGRMEPDGSNLEIFELPHADSSPRIIALGADGNMWFSEHEGNRIGRITPAGEITEFDLPRDNAGPGDITAGADGNLWFVELAGTMDGVDVDGNRVGRISPAGEVTEYRIPSTGGSPINIAVGPDRQVWFTKGAALWRVTSTGEFRRFPIPGEAVRTVGLSAGSDREPPDRLANRLWFTDPVGNRIGYLSFE